MENGLFGFFSRYSKYLGRIRSNDRTLDTELDGFRPLKLEQLYFFLVVGVIQMTIAIMVFVLELVVHRLNIKRDQRIRSNP